MKYEVKITLVGVINLFFETMQTLSCIAHKHRLRHQQSCDMYLF